MAETNLIGENILSYTVREKLGSGTFGTVYKVIKEDAVGQSIRALKHITIPTEKQYNSVLNSMGGDASKADNYFSKMLENIASEIRILKELSEQNIQHIVRYYEHDIVITDSPRRYDIFILMEYLTPLEDIIQSADFCVRDVVRLGLDILDGLQSCHNNGVIHRDIKDDNIFVSDKSEYKIGDFGVSKVLKDSSKAESLKGTPNFIAPEVYLGKQSYTKSVDLYSLGIVLYRLLNYSRNPFLPRFPEQFYDKDEKNAFEKRMNGETPDFPSLGGKKIGEVIIKAVSNRSERFQTADEFISALKQAAESTPVDVLDEKISDPPSKKYSATLHDATVGEDNSSSSSEENEEDTKNNSINKDLFKSITPPPPPPPPSPPPPPPPPPWKKLLILVGALVAVILIIALAGRSSDKSTIEDSLSTSLPTEQTQTPEPSPTPEPEPWSDRFPVDAYLNGEKIETLKQYRSSTTLEIVTEEKKDGSRPVYTEKRLVQDWGDWQTEVTESSDLIEVSEPRNVYYYRKLQAVTTVNHMVTKTEYVYGPLLTSYTPVQSNGSTKVENVVTEYQYRVYEYDYYYAVDWSEFAENVIVPDDGRVVNINTLFRTAADESENSISMDNFLSDTDAELVCADVSPDKWYYDCIASVVGSGIMDTDEFLYFLPEQSVKVCDLVRAAVAINRIYNGECGVLPADADLYYLVENDAMDRGIIRAGEFTDMDASVTRQQAATILYRVLPIKELAAVNEVTEITDMDNGTDAYRYVYQLAQAGIVTFREQASTFSPEKEIPRAEAASMLDRLMHPDRRYVRNP